MAAPRPTRTLAALVVAGALAVAAGCGDDGGTAGGAPAGATATAAVGTRTAPPPAPSGPAVLEVSGDVAPPGGGDRVVLDRAGIEGLGATRIELYEPFRKRRTAFRAVPLAAVLDAAGVPATGTVHAVALNDYSVDIPVEVARAEGTYLATATGDGAAIPVAAGGPVRVVFLDGARGADVENYWIWSLATMVAR
jgi:hypothetical protein